MIGRIVRSVDFERVLGSPIRARSAHFAVHFLLSCPSMPGKPIPMPQGQELSTGKAPERGVAVDEWPAPGRWLGTVVPKRHARRAVTRNLLKRQIRQAAEAQRGLPQGLWVVRLRNGFERERFHSAGSTGLRNEAGLELAHLMSEAAQRVAAL